MNSKSMLSQARAVAEAAHDGHLDKAGQPYIEHVLRVMRNVRGTDAKIVALLHDVIEDTPVTMGDLIAFGFPRHIRDAVDAITKREGEAYSSYLDRVRQNPLALAVKLADIADNSNLERLPPDHPGRIAMATKYADAFSYLTGQSLERLSYIGGGKWANLSARVSPAR